MRSVEEARGQLQVAEAALNAARERLAAMQKGPVGPQGEIVITAPLDGVVQSMSVASGQTVASAAPLVQIAQVNTLWVRVPVFAGDVDADRHVAAGVGQAARRIERPAAGEARHRAAQSRSGGGVDRPVLRDSRPPAPRCVLASASWSEIPLKSTVQGLVVPEAALLYDIHGDAWVYEDLGGNAYARRRVQVARHSAIAR